MPRECDSDATSIDGVLVVVRGGESPLHGEGEQFKNLLEILTNLSEVKTFDN